LPNAIQKLNSEGYKVVSQCSYNKLSGGHTIDIMNTECETWILQHE
jgi:hypothetical protein